MKRKLLKYHYFILLFVLCSCDDKTPKVYKELKEIAGESNNSEYLIKAKNFLDKTIKSCKVNSKTCTALAKGYSSFRDNHNTGKVTNLVSLSVLPALVEASNKENWCENKSKGEACEGFLRILFDNIAWADPLDGNYNGILLGKEIRKALNKNWEILISKKFYYDFKKVTCKDEIKNKYSTDDSSDFYIENKGYYEVSSNNQICNNLPCKEAITWYKEKINSKPKLVSVKYLKKDFNSAFAESCALGSNEDSCNFTKLWQCLPEQIYSQNSFVDVSMCLQEDVKYNLFLKDTPLSKEKLKDFMSGWSCLVGVEQ